MRMNEHSQPQTHPRVHPLVSFFVGVLALYCSRLVFVSNVFAEHSPLIPHVLHTYTELVHLTLSVAVILAGAAALLSGGLSLRRSGLKSRYGVAAILGAVTGGTTCVTGILYLSFIMHVAY